MLRIIGATALIATASAKYKRWIGDGTGDEVDKASELDLTPRRPGSIDLMDHRGAALSMRFIKAYQNL
ncbi:MAG: hypothetical protein WBL23_00775, partial [Salinisphaera sp.]|uniref:hypothetical protein n=1 Tax=Salinisphaera sp. TaxID=1914330 RepID=UPI003C7DB0B8